MQWLRRNFIAGFFITVPLFISVTAFIWLFRIVDGLTTPFFERLVARYIPGLYIPALGILTTAVGIVLVGALATNVIGRRLLQRGEGYLLRVPVFRTIYAPVKQLVVAFSPDNEFGFKRVVLLEDGHGYSLGFLTKEFTVDRGKGPEPLVAVYVPTNHLYLGDIVICERARATFPDVSVEEGIQIFLTGGMAIPSRMIPRSDDRSGTSGYNPDLCVNHTGRVLPIRLLRGEMSVTVQKIHGADARPDAVVGVDRRSAARWYRHRPAPRRRPRKWRIAAKPIWCFRIFRRSTFTA